MGIKVKLFKRTALLIGIILLITTLFIDVINMESVFYEFFGYESLEKYQTSYFYTIFNKLRLIIYNVCSVLIIGVVLTSQINRINREELESSHEEHNREISDQFSSFIQYSEMNIEKIKKDVFQSVFSYNLPDGIYKSLEKDLLSNPIIRKDVRIVLDINLERSNKKFKDVVEYLTFTYTLENRKNVVIEYPIEATTIELDERCVLKQLQVLQNKTKVFDFDKNNLSSEMNGEKIIDENGITRHKMIIQIEPMSSIEVTTKYLLKLGTNNSMHRNAIGLMAFSYGKLSLNIKKPKGHMFTIEMFNGKLVNVPIEHDIQNATNLNYEYSGTVYPGTGIEYTIYKV